MRRIESSALGALLLVAACSSDSKTGKETPAEDVVDAATPSDATTLRKPDAFNASVSC